MNGHAILDEAKKVKPLRVVFDSLSEFRLIAETPLRYRRQLLRLKQEFSQFRSTVLLLDDIFEKLDASRMHNLLHKVCVQQQAQVFITDTHKERLQQAFEQLGIGFELIEL